MSANLVVDLFSTVDCRPSVVVGSGSNLIVGAPVDLFYANTYCNVFCAAGIGGSGAVEVRIQTSDSILSGTFTDPTSGLAQLPVNVVSGGVIFFNSGLSASGIYSPSAVVNNAPVFASGGISFGAFQRPQRYARLILNSGPFPGAIIAGFVSQKKTVGSGAGSTQSPGSGAVSV